MVEFMRVDKSQLKPLSDCSKDLTINGEPIEDNDPSEWAIMYALNSLMDKDFTEEDFVKAVYTAMVTQVLIDLGEDGLVDMSVDEEGYDVYTITKKGLEFLEREK